MLILLFGAILAEGQQLRQLLTVTGSVREDKIKWMLSHEHVVTNFTGANEVVMTILDRTNAYRTLLPFLINLRKNGVNCLVESTPQFIGRDVDLLKKLSRKSKVWIITNTGYYAAVDKRYLPDLVIAMTPSRMAKNWLKEIDVGIGQQAIKPGFIKIGVGNDPLDSIESKLVQASVLVNQSNPITVAIHTGNFEAADSEYKLAIALGLPPGRLIWVHAQNGNDEQRKQMAEKGMWISLDGVNEKEILKYVYAILYLKGHGLLHRVLVSHDDGFSVSNDGRYHNLQAFSNGNQKPYVTIVKLLIPLLIQNGLTKREVNQLMRENPLTCFAR